VAEDLAELIQDLSERQKAMEGQLRELAEAVKALEARLAQVWPSCCFSGGDEKWCIGSRRTLRRRHWW